MQIYQVWLDADAIGSCSYACIASVIAITEEEAITKIEAKFPQMGQFWAENPESRKATPQGDVSILCYD